MDEANKRLIEIMSDVLFEVQGMRKEMNKINIGLAENSRAILKLAEKIEDIADHENRLRKLEQAVFK